MMKLAVIGKDVSKSLSPRMHTFIFDKMGGACSYEAVSVSPSEFARRAETLFTEYDGLNVTIPFKAEIIPYLKKLDGDAPVFGAVNTVLTASRTGYNTDGFGFLLMLENAGVEVKGKSVLVLGAGGAGRSCIKKLKDAGAEVFVYERDGARLQAVANEFGAAALHKLPLRAFDILLNCTGIGMHDTVGSTPGVRYEDGERPIGEELISLCSVAVDLIYVPPQSEFLRIAESLGKKTVNGESMLFYQAYMADCIFLGRTPDAEEAKKFWHLFREVL